MSDAHTEELQRKLWAVANELRGKMSADEYKDYMLGFIFYKYLSENIQKHLDEELHGDGITFLDTLDTSNLPADDEERQELLDGLKAESLESLGYYLPPNLLFATIAEKANNGEFIIDELFKAFTAIETSGLEASIEADQKTAGESVNNFAQLFEDVDLTSTKLGHSADERNKLIAKVIAHFNDLGFSFADAEADLLGDAYEYLISQFASEAGKKGGEFFTPQKVSTILARIVTTGKKNIRRAYDPTCGSGSLLLRMRKEANVSEYYGQEMNRTTYNLARMNLMLHRVKPEFFHLTNNDTLEYPAYMDTGFKFDAVVANPPFSANWSAADLFKTDERFAPYGVLAPKTKADYAFVCHMVYMLEDNGTMAVVVPHGVLFREASEGKIRRFLIEKMNALDAVIGLPKDIFYGTGIPTAILVFKKCREENDAVLFIDASLGFEKGKNQNTLRDEDVDRIIDTFRNRTEIDKFSRNVPLEEIAINDYNLNISRYLSTAEDEVRIDLDAVANDIQIALREEAEIDARLSAMFAELGIPFPSFNGEREK